MIRESGFVVVIIIIAKAIPACSYTGTDEWGRKF